MIVKLTVFKEVHNTWPAKNGKAGGESFDLLCMDMSEPPQYRMEEMLYYRLQEAERPLYWGKSCGQMIEVGVSKIRTGSDTGGKAVLQGQIMVQPARK